MISKISAVVPYGFEGKLVEVEGDTAKGLPAFNIVGMANKTINEARERVRSAVVNSGFAFPTKKVTINLAPAELPKDGTYLDLPIALSILVLSGQLLASDVRGKIFVGELSLDGKIKPVRGIINVIEAAKRHGYKKIYVPIENLPQASLIRDVEIYGAENGIIALNVAGVHPQDTAEILSQEGIAVRAGWHCAQPMLEFLGIGPVVRVSLSFYNTEEEVEKVARVLGEVRCMMRNC